MKKGIILLLLVFSLCSSAQQSYKYTNTLNVTRSNNTAFTHLLLMLPCPQTNEYQTIRDLDYQSQGNWTKKDIEENQNSFFELGFIEDQLTSLTPNFSVGISFIHTPKTIATDFSELKNTDGSWKDLPPYDTTTSDYQDNVKKSGTIVDPENSTIQTISENLYQECNGNKLAYAEKCYNYVAANYNYLNPNTGIHPLADLLAAGGGDCGNLSSIYISLLRAKGIPARHVVALAANNNFHVWAEFYIQDFGWVPVDVTYKNSNRSGNYFGRYNYNMVVVQKGVAMDYSLEWLGTVTLDLLQTYCYWYWYKTPATLSIRQTVTSEYSNYDGIDDLTVPVSDDGNAKKVLKNGQLVIKNQRKEYLLNGVLVSEDNKE